MKTNRLYKWAYIIMAVMTLIMIGISVYATVSGSATLFKGPLVYILFGVYFAVQIVCIFLFKPGASVYKIGFYFTHAGLLVLLIGAFLFVLFGQTVYSEVPIDKSGKYYVAIGNGENRTDLGFGLRVDSLNIERYEDGSDKSYGSGVTLFDYSENTGMYHESEKKTLAVNAPLRKYGWKLYFMSYSDGVRSGDGRYLLPMAVSAEGEMTEREPLREFAAEGGAEAVSMIMADGTFAGKSVAYFIYDPSSGTYALSSPSAAGGLEGRLTVRVFENAVDGYAVYVSQNSLLILFKKDPGEFFVIGGMVLTVIGAVMMCLIKKRSKLPDSAHDGKSAEEKKGGDAK